MSYSKSYSNVDFQGEWPDMLRAEVEKLIAQYGSSSVNKQAPSSSQSFQWIAQHNPSPTGPLYAVGRLAKNGLDALGPVIGASGSDLLEKLRALLR
jgi:hypothetical protein